ncbi:MAG: YeiH family putative sulfate export transporter [Xanthobacteraceae bacterium]|nr:YeiH family putative sulfate export transporter [Xanthobacteraceae bacterium]MBX3549243.1 YeiH family putative sulfate export transporter [Xanthobacteraceae bacterium]
MPVEENTKVSQRHPRPVGSVLNKLPGIFLCLLIALGAIGLERLELQVLAFPYVGAVVLAILIGMAVRQFWQPSERWVPGISFSAKQILEVAVVLLGASISFSTIVKSGLILILVIVATVALALFFTYYFSRMLGLSQKLSILIACGNSICGNSAIATVAPVIRADANDVAASVSFTAILGVLVVLGLPLLIPLLQLSQTQYGILAGLTVYAVPQVLATTLPAGLLSTQVGTLVKLVRVLMLGPIVMGFSLMAARQRRKEGRDHTINFFKLVPWFILGFLVFVFIRSLGLLSEEIVSALTQFAILLTVISMAALGLGVDLRVLTRVGGRVTLAVTLSLILLLAVSLVTVQFFN